MAKLDEIQAALLQRARAFREEHTTRVSSYDEFKSVMEGRPGFVIAGWCGGAECEAQIKADTQATLRNIPFGGVDVDGDLREVRQAVAVGSLVRQGLLTRRAVRRRSAHQIGRRLRPARQHPLDHGVTACQPFALDDRAEGGRDVLAPPRSPLRDDAS